MSSVPVNNSQVNPSPPVLEVPATEGGQSQQNATTLDYDQILEVIGGFGPFQRKVYALMTIPVVFTACSVMNSNFVGGLPNYRCYIPTCDNETGSHYNAPWVNNTAPEDEKGLVSACTRYNVNFTSAEQCYAEPACTNQTITCDSWVFDNSIFKSTLVTEFELTCEKEFLRTLVESLFMVGMLIGSFPIGNLADKIGRRYCFFTLVLWMGTFNLACAFAPNYITFTTLRAFAGATGESMYTMAFITGVEMVGKEYRTISSLCFQMCYTIGSLLTGLASYFIRDWRTLQCVLSAPVFLLLFYWWFLPESPRWLISQGRLLEAQKIILVAAKANGKVIPSHMLLPLDVQNDVGDTQVQRSTEAFGENQAKIDKKALAQEAGSLVLVFKNRILRKRALVIFIAWTVAGLGYFGLSMASVNLVGNMYLNFELSALIEIPSALIETFLISRVGRSVLLSFSFLLCGICCIIAGSLKGYPVIINTFSLMGKFFVNLAFGATYSFSTELFPTAARSAVMGLCVTFSGLGNILAPVVASFGLREESLPYLIIGIATFIAGSATIILPETADQPLPETLQQAEDLEKIGPGVMRLFKRKTPETVTETTQANVQEFKAVAISISFSWSGVPRYRSGLAASDVEMSLGHYEPSPFELTLVSEFNLVCNNKWKQTLVGSLYMTGMLSSCIPVGNFSDRFGEKIMVSYRSLGLVAVTTEVYLFGCNLSCAMATNHVVHEVFRLLAGAAGSSVLQVAFILSVEIVGPR